MGSRVPGLRRMTRSIGRYLPEVKRSPHHLEPAA
jgi:hypothetical protein